MKKHLLVWLVTLMLILYTESALAASWRWVESSDTTGWYIDINSLNYKWSYNGGNMYICFWSMEKYEDPDYRYEKAKQAKKYYPYFDFNGFYYEIGKQEYYYKNNQLYCRFLSSNFYRKDDSLIGSDNSVSGWTAIVPNSVGEMLYYKALGLYNEIYEK